MLVHPRPLAGRCQHAVLPLLSPIPPSPLQSAARGIFPTCTAAQVPLCLRPSCGSTHKLASEGFPGADSSWVGTQLSKRSQNGFRSEGSSVDLVIGGV